MKYYIVTDRDTMMTTVVKTLRGVLIHLKMRREEGTLRSWFISDLTIDKFLVVTDQFFEGMIVCHHTHSADIATRTVGCSIYSNMGNAV